MKSGDLYFRGSHVPGLPVMGVAVCVCVDGSSGRRRWLLMWLKNLHLDVGILQPAMNESLLVNRLPPSGVVDLGQVVELFCINGRSDGLWPLGALD